MSQPDDQPNQSDPSNQPQGDLANELRELGQQLENAVRNAMENEKAKQIQKDLSAGLREIGTQLQSAVESLKENPHIQELVEKSEQAVNQAQQSKVTQDFQETLARGIAQLNDQLAAFVTRIRSEQDPPASGPATGETTRLDPEDK
ncbi:hypothetical protein EYB53_017785 [Candidatus Chloroploca sp. M-50]|uniref:Uncharacterized protein n=1 Tax=Candidatus Chloroploca mongolica TaxID=2528176 RepID=A0ABS4DDP4_9CHLR|nr:hypothetical protein [Candidatus Chloroploca mongolica]MBP1467569.1 hypothetical protein [Candidatus Chloroploca mongolica]